MTIWEFLTTPQGIEITHALILLAGAAAAVLSQLAHRQARINSRKLNGHLAQHNHDQAPPT